MAGFAHPCEEKEARIAEAQATELRRRREFDPSRVRLRHSTSTVRPPEHEPTSRNNGNTVVDADESGELLSTEGEHRNARPCARCGRTYPHEHVPPRALNTSEHSETCRSEIPRNPAFDSDSDEEDAGTSAQQGKTGANASRNALYPRTSLRRNDDTAADYSDDDE